MKENKAESKGIPAALKRGDFTFKKKFGQNFITDTNLLRSIVSDAGVTKDDTVIEVGVGAGGLTTQIAGFAKRVIGFEIDKTLEPVLKEALSGYDNISLHFEDILSVTPEKIHALTRGESYKLVANLPYYITTPIIFKFLTDEKCTDMTLMVQKEVADRLRAGCGTKDYGAITAKINALAKAEVTRKVSRNLFIPVPNVDSAVIKIQKKPVIRLSDTDGIFKLISAAFHMRRKTLANNLSAVYNIGRPIAEKIIVSAGFDPAIRGEKLSIHDFMKLYKELKAHAGQ